MAGEPRVPKRIEVVVKGRVQGVGFRYFVADRARDLRLVGTVCNLRSGDVQVVAEGDEGGLEALLAALRQGPRMSHVESVHAVWRPPTGEFTRFSVSPTR